MGILTGIGEAPVGLLALGRVLRAVLAARSVKVLGCPLLILHAEDDGVVPPKLGRKVGTCHPGFEPGFGGLKWPERGWPAPRRGLGSPARASNRTPAPRQLYETARKAYKDKSKVKFITFPEKLGLGHDYISFHPELPALVK